jgi:membrane protease subunit HflC
MRIFLAVVAVAVALGLASMCVLSVDRSEFVYVTQFGEPVRTYDGATQAGLHLRWPWPIQSVQRVDRRLQVFNLPSTDQLIADPDGVAIDRRLTIEAYVCWRIADAEGVDQFIRAVGTPEQAQKLLATQISTRLGAVIGDKMVMDDFISDQPDRVNQGMGRLRERLLGPGRDSSSAKSAGLAAQALKAYGIEIVDIRLRRYNYPQDVYPKIIDRIKSEREKKKAQYESEATIKVGQIRQDNELKVRTIEAKAAADARRLRGQADAEADQIRNQAFSKDVEFYVFLKKLEEYQSILGENRAVLLLSSNRKLFDLLFSPPAPNGAPVTGPMAAPSKPATGAASKGGR